MNKAKSMNPAERPAVAKQTLALAYFPDSSPRVAVNHLRAWLQRCRPLWARLTALPAFNPHAKMYTVREVALIEDYIGPPYAGGA